MRYFLIALVSFASFFFFGSTTYAAPTFFGGEIIEDTVWTASSSPYVLTGMVTISQGVTLTLEKGVVVKPSARGIVVDGTLNLQGTETDPVYITSQKDDTVGGDSNGDGSSTSPSPGNWQGIQFNAGATGTFEYTVVEYAGYMYSGVIPKISTIHNLGADVTIRDSVFSYNNTCAVGQSEGSLVMENSELHDLECGVVALGGSVKLHNNHIKDTVTGLFVNGSDNIELTDNSFESNKITADITLSPVVSLINTGNTAVGGVLDGLIIRGTLSNDLLLKKDSMPYLTSSGGGSRGSGGFSLITEGTLSVNHGVRLTLDPGVILKFQDASRLAIAGALSAIGTHDESVYFTSIKDDTVGGDTNGDGGSTVPEAGNWADMQFVAGSEGTFENTVMKYGGRNTSLSSGAIIHNKGGAVSIQNSELAFGKLYGILNSSGTTTINQSFIHDNVQYGILNSSQKLLDATQNYWGDASGPQQGDTNPDGQGDRVSNYVEYTPWKSTHCLENCFSSVLFLPGIQASRLYMKNNLGNENRIWEPDVPFSQDVIQLALFADGTSQNEVYTKDILTSIPFGGTVYDSFARFMVHLTEDEKVIADWTPFAYDWRYGVADVAQNGTQYEEGIRDAIDEIEHLASSSFSGKVTIIGHSNGGLLAKAIMQRLEQEGRTNLVDKVIFIASPQLGTPKAIGTILHGYDQEKLGGWLIDDVVARKVINNMPGAYALLPSEKYFEGLLEPIVTFAGDAIVNPYRQVYGSSISSYAEYLNFLRGVDGLGRDLGKPASVPAPANSLLLDESLLMHDTQLDDWSAPNGVEVIEIVGTGLPTMKSVEYRGVIEDECIVTVPVDLFCTPKSKIKPYAVLTHYGDGTVVQRSAEAYRGEKVMYFINLESLNRMRESEGSRSIYHHNITEVPFLQELLSNLLVGTSTNENQFISTSYTEFDNSYDVEIIDSPVRLLATDTLGNQTGIVIIDGVATIKEDIPNSQYFEFGDTKYFVVPKGTDRTTKLYGEDYGGYTLTTAVLDSADTQIIKTVLSNATVTPNMLVEYSNENGEFSTVHTDIDGDGTIDYKNTLNGELVEEEVIVTYSVLIKTIDALDFSKGHKKVLLLLVKGAEYYSNKQPSKTLYRKLEDRLLKSAEKFIKRYVNKHYLAETDAVILQDMIQVLKNKQ